MVNRRSDELMNRLKFKKKTFSSPAWLDSNPDPACEVRDIEGSLPWLRIS